MTPVPVADEALLRTRLSDPFDVVVGFYETPARRSSHHLPLALLRHAQASADQDLRAEAIGALDRHGGPEIDPLLTAALADRARAVRAAAARALLGRPPDRSSPARRPRSAATC